MQAVRVQAVRVQAVRVQAVRVQAVRVQAVRVQAVSGPCRNVRSLMCAAASRRGIGAQVGGCASVWSGPCRNALSLTCAADGCKVGSFACCLLVIGRLDVQLRFFDRLSIFCDSA